jgi:hypothetical protein
MVLRTIAAAGFLILAGTVGAAAAEMQGVLADWACVKSMVHDGRAKVLKRNSTCSLNNNYSRAAYGLITDDKRYFKLDDAGREWALKLLKDTGDKDNLRVIVTGDVDGGTIHVQSMSEL